VEKDEITFSLNELNWFKTRVFACFTLIIDDLLLCFKSIARKNIDSTVERGKVFAII
jgi:hypothetical protein